MATIYGAQPYNFQNNAQNMMADALGANSVAFTQYDPVTYASGVLATAGTTNSVLGVTMKTQTMTSTNAQRNNAGVQVEYVPVDETTQFLMGSNGDHNTIADVGTYWKLTASTTGSIQVDQANGVQTTTNRVVLIKQVDPFNEGTTGSGSGARKVVVVFVRRPTWIDQ